jgi:SAM-dependent methyltransferase
MGISKPTAVLLIEEGLLRPFAGAMLQLGRQDIEMTRDELAAILRRHGQGRFTDVGAGHTPPSDQEFFRALGFSAVDSLDASDFEGASIVFDLNQATPPDALCERFDVVFNGGTLEHVFHLPNALANLHAMLRPGGRAIHLAPASNYLDHGFYAFSPGFFVDYYRANGYEPVALKLVRLGAGSHDHRAAVLDLDPRSTARRPLSFVGSLDGAAYMIFFVAIKRPEASAARIPIQALYADSWSAENRRSRIARTHSDRAEGRSHAASLLAQIAAIPIAGPWLADLAFSLGAAIRRARAGWRRIRP